MCDGDFDTLERCGVWNTITRRARCPRVCDVCEETIKAGSTYKRTTTMLDGHFSHYHHCERCWSLYQALVSRYRQDGQSFLPEEMMLLSCGESWESVFGEPAPEHVQKLAFTKQDEI